MLIQIVALHAASLGCIVTLVGCLSYYCAALFVCCDVSFDAFMKQEQSIEYKAKAGMQLSE
jgi:hypothetical protein